MLHGVCGGGGEVRAGGGARVNSVYGQHCESQLRPTYPIPHPAQAQLPGPILTKLRYCLPATP